MSDEHDERLRRWRLILGGGEADGTGASLNERDQRMDEVLEQLYGRKKIPAPGLGSRFGQGKGGFGNKTPGASRFGQGSGRQGGMEASMPDVARWLGDIRTYFPASVVRIMQRDAIERIGLQHLLSQPEFLEMVEPDVNL